MQNKVICLKVIVFLFYNKNIIRENSAHIYFFVKHIYNLSSKIHDMRCDNNTGLWIHVHTAILQNATIIFVLKIYIKTPLKLSK